MMAVSEDIYDQLERKQIWKEGFFTKERVRNALRSFTYNCLDLDLKQYFTDRRRIRILSALSKDFAILKPDKGNGIVILNRSDYTKSLRSIFDDKSKFTHLNEDPTSGIWSTRPTDQLGPTNLAQYEDQLGPTSSQVGPNNLSCLIIGRALKALDLDIKMQ